MRRSTINKQKHEKIHTEIKKNEKGINRIVHFEVLPHHLPDSVLFKCIPVIFD